MEYHLFRRFGAMSLQRKLLHSQKILTLHDVSVFNSATNQYSSHTNKSKKKNANSCGKTLTNDKALLDINPLQLKLLSIIMFYSSVFYWWPYIYNEYYFKMLFEFQNFKKISDMS